MLTRLSVRLLMGLFALSLASSGVALGQSASPATFPTAAGMQLVAEGFTSPVTLVESPDGTGRLFVVDQAGMIWIVNAGGQRAAQPFLDLRDRMVQLNARYDERGLLGLAFHPRYRDTGRLFVYYSAPLRQGAPEGWNHTARLSELRVASGDPNRADPASERVLMSIDQPQSNHNGGTLAFGPRDGFLYLSLGDGGGRDDMGVGHVPGGNGQDVTQNLLGSIVRIDVDQGSPYGIPADNPFAQSGGMPEQWAWGFRNPYRFSFDIGGEHALWVGDAGQELWEEFNIVQRAGNYGWPVREGAHCFDAAAPTRSPATCAERDAAGQTMIGPVVEFLNSKQPGGVGLAGVGGYVYRGARLPQLGGRYIFGVWSRGSGFANTEGGAVYVAEPCANGRCSYSKLWLSGMPGGQLSDFIMGFGQDRAGEVYVLTSTNLGPSGSTGKVWRLVPAR